MPKSGRVKNGDSSMFNENRISGMVLGIAGAFVLYLSSDLRGAGATIGPGVFPGMIASVLIVAGVIIAFGRPREAVETEHDDAELALHPLAKLARLSLPPVLLLFYYASADSLGFYLAAGAMMFTSCLALGGKLRLASLMGLSAPPVIFFLFTTLLNVPLPPLLPMFSAD